MTARKIEIVMHEHADWDGPAPAELLHFVPLSAEGCSVAHFDEQMNPKPACLRTLCGKFLPSGSLSAVTREVATCPGCRS